LLDDSLSPLIKLFPILSEKLPMSPPSKELLDQLRDQIQGKDYSSRTGETKIY